MVIGCKTLENEIRCTAEKTQINCQFEWVEAGLHNTPDRLKNTLQDKLDHATGYTNILLAMGFCGNAIHGVKNRDSVLVVPRVDDCISLLLGSCSRRQKLSRECPSYFLTEGWLNGNHTIWKEYQYANEKFGTAQSEILFKKMFEHYQALTLIDTGCYDMESAMAETGAMAQKLGLDSRVVNGTLVLLERLFAGDWDPQNFVRVMPNERIQAPVTFG